MIEDYQKCSLEEFKNQINDWLERSMKGHGRTGHDPKMRQKKHHPQ